MTRDPAPERLLGHLAHFAGVYPAARRDLEEFRARRGPVPPWPEGCLVPGAAARATVRGTLEVAAQRGLIDPARIPDAVARDAPVVAALHAWRLGKGLYRFDPALLATLAAAPPRPDRAGGGPPRLPEWGLPEWGVYVEAPPGLRQGGREVLGAFAHLDWDAETRRAALGLAIDSGRPQDLVALSIPLGGPLRGGAARAGAGGRGSRRPVERRTVEWFVACLAFLGSPWAAYAGGGRPERAPTGTRSNGARFFPPARPRTWHVQARPTAPDPDD